MPLYISWAACRVFSGDIPLRPCPSVTVDGLLVRSATAMPRLSLATHDHEARSIVFVRAHTPEYLHGVCMTLARSVVQRQHAERVNGVCVRPWNGRRPWFIVE
jgi:hypothetical protein